MSRIIGNLVMSLRLTPEDRARLERLAYARRNVHGNPAPLVQVIRDALELAEAVWLPKGEPVQDPEWRQRRAANSNGH